MLTSILALTLVASAAERPGIAWYTDLAQGLAAAKQTGRPILLMAAAPQCAEVPGDW